MKESIYHVVITEVDAKTNALIETHLDTNYKNVSLIADSVDGNIMTEVILNDNLIGIATKLLQATKMKEAVLLASEMVKILSGKTAEGKLFNAFKNDMMGGK